MALKATTQRTPTKFHESIRPAAVIYMSFRMLHQYYLTKLEVIAVAVIFAIQGIEWPFWCDISAIVNLKDYTAFGNRLCGEDA